MFPSTAQHAPRVQATGPAIHAELFSGLLTSVEKEVGLADVEEDVVDGVDVAKYFGFVIWSCTWW
jgi:hypothetical protein